MSFFSKVSLSAASVLVLASAVTTARATTPPSDPCSLLAASDVNAATGGGTFGTPESTAAIKPYASSGPGTDCHYKSSNGSLLFRIYFDSSTDAATGLFNQLKMFFPPVSTPSGLGDDAYFDNHSGLHVRKGNVRFFLSGSPTNPQLQAMATVVAGRL